MTETQRKAKTKYKAKIKRIVIEFYPTDSALWEKIKNIDNKQGFIKTLLRKALD